MNEYGIDDIAEGLSQQFDVVVTETMMQRFLKISGDCNKLHLSNSYAKSKGFKKKVVYGMLISSFYSTLAGVYLPGKHCLLQGIDISFHNAVYVGDKLTVSGEVVYINKAYKQIEIKALIKNGKGKKVSKARIKAGVSD